VQCRFLFLDKVPSSDLLCPTRFVVVDLFSSCFLYCSLTRKCARSRTFFLSSNLALPRDYPLPPLYLQRDFNTPLGLSCVREISSLSFSPELSYARASLSLPLSSPSGPLTEFSLSHLSPSPLCLNDFHGTNPLLALQLPRLSPLLCRFLRTTFGLFFSHPPVS